MRLEGLPSVVPVLTSICSNLADMWDYMRDFRENLLLFEWCNQMHASNL